MKAVLLDTRTRALVWWTVSLLPDGLREKAAAELDATGEGISPEQPAEPIEPIAATLVRLRAASTVIAADAALPASPDWAGLAEAHAREPFDRIRRRALIARKDCPDELVLALLEPWDSLVAGRLAARQAVPRELLRPIAAHIGYLRPSVYGTLPELLARAARRSGG